ncbi:hypothetical protein N7486_001258 [Penicillium sp. IBT 16267x]|nr:hypothetical protein N7486_001258 [Penicillium sp. IBT 16267x]
MPSELKIRYQKALTTVSSQHNPNIKCLARWYDLPYRTLLRRFRDRGKRDVTKSAQRALNPVQEAALIQYIEPLDDLWGPYTLQEIERCANSILARSIEEPVGKMWASRFVKRLPKRFFWIRQKPLDKKRIESEDIAHITTWFEHFGRWIEGISPKNIYNFDRTGFQLGQARAQKIVTRYKASAQKIAAIDRG